MADTKKTVDELRGKKTGEMGFGQIFNDPRLNDASVNLAGNMGYDTSAALMAMGRPQAVPYGGKKAWSEAAAEGLKTGLGVYNMLRTQKDKQTAMAEQLRRYKELYPQTGGEQLYDAEGTPMRPDGTMGFTYEQS